jgi:hypothetical protein
MPIRDDDDLPKDKQQLELLLGICGVIINVYDVNNKLKTL